MTDTNNHTITVSNNRKSGAIQVIISQSKQKTIQQTIEAGQKKEVKVYPGRDSLQVSALDYRKGEVITVRSEMNPDKSETKSKPPYDFSFTLDIPEVSTKSETSEDNIVVVDDEE